MRPVSPSALSGTLTIRARSRHEEYGQGKCAARRRAGGRGRQGRGRRAALLSAAFAVGDKVVVEGLKAKPKYNGKAAVVRGRVNARGRFPVTVEMRDGPETIALKLANLRAADE